MKIHLVASSIPPLLRLHTHPLAVFGTTSTIASPCTRELWELNRRRAAAPSHRSAWEAFLAPAHRVPGASRAWGFSAASTKFTHSINCRSWRSCQEIELLKWMKFKGKKIRSTMHHSMCQRPHTQPYGQAQCMGWWLVYENCEDTSL